jgi:hypothetical protein
MPVQSNVQKVTLVPKPNGGWTVTHHGQSGDHPGSGAGSYPMVKAAKDSGANLVDFQLSGNHHGITFAQVNPFSVQAGQKPGIGSGATDAQVPVWAATPDGKELFVVDLNNNDSSLPPLQLHYALAFDGHDGLDPVIENGGGIKTGHAYSALQVAVVGLAAAAIFFFIGGFVQRRFQLFG